MDPCVIPHRNEPIRIAMLSLHSSPTGRLGTQDTGGMSVYVREVAKWLAKFGHRVDIFTCAPSSRQCIELYPKVRLICLNLNSDKAVTKEALFDYIPQVVQSLVQYAQMENVQYQLVHSHYWLSGVAGEMVRSHWRCPHVTMFHTLGMIKNSTTPGESEPRLRIRHERNLVQSVNAIVAPADPEKTNLLRHYGATRSKVHVVPCGVNMDRFKPVDKEYARATLKLDPASRLILFVGRFAPVKGLDLLLKALANLVPRHPHVKLLVVGGDGPEAEAAVALARQARQLEVNHHLSLVGRIDHDELPLYYSAADMLVLSSSYESFGLVTLEALACGTPVAAPTTGGAASVIREGTNGVLIEQPDHQSIGRGIEQLLTLVAQQALSVEQIRSSVSGFSWECIAAMNLKIYDALLSRE